jgi:hypothetical protein
VLKDPRICRILPLWRQILEEMGIDVRIVLPLRNPLEVADSLLARNGFSRDRGVFLWLRHVLDAEQYSRGAVRTFVRYVDFLRDWRTAVRQIEQSLGVVLPPRTSSIDDQLDGFLDPGLRHQASDDMTLLSSYPHSSLVYRTYQALERLVRAENDDRP